MGTHTFALTRQVHLCETDLAGVMHFSNYFRWMEDTEHAFLRAIGLQPLSPSGGVTVGFPRVHCACDYRTPLRFGDSVELTLRVVRVGDRSVEYAVDFTRAGTTVASGTITAACCVVEGGTFRGAPIPPGHRTALEAHVAPCAAPPAR